MNIVKWFSRKKGKTYNQQIEITINNNEELDIYELQNRSLQSISDFNYRKNIRKQAEEWFNEWLQRDCKDGIILINPKYCIRTLYVVNPKPIDFKEEAFKEFKRLKNRYLDINI